VNCAILFYIDKYFDDYPVFLTEVFPDDNSRVMNEAVKRKVKVYDHNE
jgi:hypothetical protein